MSAEAESPLLRGLLRRESLIDEILHERERQIEVEGFSYDHDSDHDDHDLARAAAAYCLAAVDESSAFGIWPWHDGWKPKDRGRNLIRAAALILAELERLDTPHGPGAMVGARGRKSITHQLAELLAINREVLANSRELLRANGRALREEHVLTQSIQDLIDAVAEDTTITAGLSTAVTGVTAKIDELLAELEAATNPAEVKAAVDAIRANNANLRANVDALSAALVQGTATEPTPPADQAPE